MLIVVVSILFFGDSGGARVPPRVAKHEDFRDAFGAEVASAARAQATQVNNFIFASRFVQRSSSINFEGGSNRTSSMVAIGWQIARCCAVATGRAHSAPQTVV
jgi:uncharacterized MAPEG superfamily protein